VDLAPKIASPEQRAALVERLRLNAPQAMRERKQWLLWQTEWNAEREAWVKAPYYIAGGKRYGKLGGEEDRRKLASLDDALERFAASRGYTGIGFAFLEDDGLIGIDLDETRDPESGELRSHHTEIIEACPSYTEWSPSGNGVHIIVAGGAVDSFKHDGIGVEVYCGGRYFTCTGDRHASQPEEVQPIKAFALTFLQQMVQAAKDADKASRKAAAPAAAPAPSAPARQHQAQGQQTDNFRRVNDLAHQSLHRWVPQLFPAATEFQGGYRVTSKALGRKLQEDLQLLPAGIMDFGEERGMSPIDVVMAWLPGCSKPKDALEWLASRIGEQLQPTKPKRQQAEPNTPAEEPESASTLDTAPAGADASSSADAAALADNVVPIGKAKRPRAPAAGKGGEAPAARPPKKLPKDVLDLVDALCARFSLIYSTDQAWDGLELMLVRIPAMRLAFGKTAVNIWLARSAPQRKMIRPVDLVFEPGQNPPPPAVNMYAGLALEPVACEAAEVAPMLALLRHLCSESVLARPGDRSGDEEGKADDVDAVMHWVLCWMALPLQQIGTKMATACVFHGAQGTGKNLFWDVWRDLFGVYGITVGQTELEDKFNGWISRKLAIVGDEVVSRQEMYHNKNRLKMVVTQQDKFPIRGMQQETRWESNHANVVFLSNESQPLALEERDRRYMVIYTPLEADAALYEAAKAFKAAGGAAKWLYFLQNYSLDGFAAHTKPLMTRAKEDLVRAGWKSSILFAHEWLEGVLDLPVRVCSNEQLYRAFRRWADNTGAKWPPDQGAFTAEVHRWARESVQRLSGGAYEAPRLSNKAFALPAVPGRHRRTVRCWLPRNTGPREGTSEGQWAAESVDEFEEHLQAFCRPRGAASTGEEK
jgi:hypothetical protein